VAVWGGQRLMTKNHKVRFSERFGVPIDFAFGEAIGVGPDDDVREVTARLQVTMQELVDTLQVRYSVDGTDKWWQPVHLGGTAPTPVEAAAADEARERRRAATRK